MKQCSCGNNRNSEEVIHKSQYTSLGWILFSLLGISAKPVRVDFTCTKCGETFESTTDPEVLKEYQGR